MHAELQRAAIKKRSSNHHTSDVWLIKAEHLWHSDKITTSPSRTRSPTHFALLDKGSENASISPRRHLLWKKTRGGGGWKGKISSICLNRWRDRLRKVIYLWSHSWGQRGSHHVDWDLTVESSIRLSPTPQSEMSWKQNARRGGQTFGGGIQRPKQKGNYSSAFNHDAH